MQYEGNYSGSYGWKFRGKSCFKNGYIWSSLCCHQDVVLFSQFWLHFRVSMVSPNSFRPSLMEPKWQSWLYLYILLVASTRGGEGLFQVIQTECSDHLIASMNQSQRPRKWLGLGHSLCLWKRDSEVEGLRLWRSWPLPMLKQDDKLRVPFKKGKWVLGGEIVSEHDSGGFATCLHLHVSAWVCLYQIFNKCFKVKDLEYLIYLLPGKVFYSASARYV